MLDPLDLLQRVVGQLFLLLLLLVLRAPQPVHPEAVDARHEVHFLRLGHQVGVHLGRFRLTISRILGKEHPKYAPSTSGYFFFGR
jgi:hypothetical protein